MREIKFRGFDEENNCWRYGWYTRLVEGARVFDAIICFDDDGILTRYYIHDNATIGQFTGLHDKNGVEIYDGDVVLRQFGVGYSSKMYASFVDGTQRKETETIIWNEIYCGYKFLAPPDDDEWFQDFEVIGNIHEGEQTC